MEFQQFYLGCLAHASYLVGDGGEAAVVDPQRDVEVYLEAAQSRGLRIRYVIETHLHADFVSGHRELAERTGAQIVFGARARATFPHRAVRDGDEIRLGGVVLRFLETPGHTPEGVSVLVLDGGGPRLVLTGDTLFVGDVGRPDLAGGAGFEAADMAGLLYDSLHHKLLALPDDVAVYPAHVAGSLCGKNISPDRSSTIGRERAANHALRPMDREAFVRLVTADLPEVPAYFQRDVAMNRSGAATVGSLREPDPLSPADFAREAAGAQVIDVRPPAEFAAGHVPGALNLSLRGEFASWCGALLSPDRPILVVAEEGPQVQEAVVRLARVGLENVCGHLAGGMASWIGEGRPTSRLERIEVEALDRLRQVDASLQVLDVRRDGEHVEGHVPGARNVPLHRLADTEVDRSRPLAVLCQGGYRSAVACSLLLRRPGQGPVFDVVGGTAAWRKAGLSLETGLRPA
jgi:hydroxyacylglutathione hydrolase